MASFEIIGGNKLFGKVKIEKSKNAILPIMAASLMAHGTTTITNVPDFSDIKSMAKIIESLGAKVTFVGSKMIIDASSIKHGNIVLPEANKIRASVFLMGPLLARLKYCKMTKPGGCAIGARPIDIHLNGFKSLGIAITETDGEVVCDAQSFCGGNVFLRMASVGATENLVMCSVLGKSKTILHGAAKEPEVVCLCDFLNKMGANIIGAGTDTITIVGVRSLCALKSYQPISDRIVAGTYLLAVCLAGGKVKICDANPDHNQSLIDFLRGFGCNISCKSDIIYVRSNGLCAGSANICTGPYPEFATDLQSQTMAFLAGSNGKHVITENMFEARFKHAVELNKMGATIVLDGKVATICGKTNCYHGASVTCHDLRGGAALVIAALAAKGKTTISQTEFIERGYDHIEQKLAHLGAKILRKQNEEEKHHRN